MTEELREVKSTIQERGIVKGSGEMPYRLNRQEKKQVKGVSIYYVER